MASEISPELFKYLRAKRPVPYELVIEIYNKFVEAYGKLQRHQAGRHKKYHTPEEANQMKCLQSRESYYRKKERLSQQEASIQLHVVRHNRILIYNYITI